MDLLLPILFWKQRNGETLGRCCTLGGAVVGLLSSTQRGTYTKATLDEMIRQIDASDIRIIRHWSSEEDSKGVLCGKAYLLHLLKEMKLMKRGHIARIKTFITNEKVRTPNKIFQRMEYRDLLRSSPPLNSVVEMLNLFNLGRSFFKAMKKVIDRLEGLSNLKGIAKIGLAYPNEKPRSIRRWQIMYPLVRGNTWDPHAVGVLQRGLSLWGKIYSLANQFPFGDDQKIPKCIRVFIADTLEIDEKSPDVNRWLRLPSPLWVNIIHLRLEMIFPGITPGAIRYLIRYHESQQK